MGACRLLREILDFGRFYYLSLAAGGRVAAAQKNKLLRCQSLMA